MAASARSDEPWDVPGPPAGAAELLLREPGYLVQGHVPWAADLQDPTQEPVVVHCRLDGSRDLLDGDEVDRVLTPPKAERSPGPASGLARQVQTGLGGEHAVRAIHQAGLAGAGPVPAPERSDEMSATEVDPVEILRNWATLATEVAPRTAPIMLLVRAAAATDPEMSATLGEMNRQRLDRMAHNARRLAARAGLRPD